MKETIELRNESDTFIYSLEKLLKDNADKVEPAEKESIESGIAELKKAMEGDDLEAIRNARANLEKASHAFAQRMYQQTAQQAQEGGATPGGSEQQNYESGGGEEQESSNGEKVYDADYEVVDDDKK